MTFTSTPFYTGTPTGETLVDNFDGPIADGFSFEGGQLEQGTYVYSAAPAGDTSTYDAVTRKDSATFSSSALLSTLSVYLGSLDSYNDLAFIGPDGTVQGLYTGSQLVADADGDQHDGATNREFVFTFTSPVDEVVFGSAGTALEFDNIAVSAAPEPSTWALMIAGVAGLGLALRRSKRQLGFSVAGSLAG